MNNTLYLSYTVKMSGISIEYYNHSSPENDGLNVRSCRFSGRYKTNTPSLVEGMANSDLIIDGIAGVEQDNSLLRTLPLGQLHCRQCNNWNTIDRYNRAWAVRNGFGDGGLLIDGLICETCVHELFIPGARFRFLCQEESLIDIRRSAKQASTKKVIRKWRSNVNAHKERSEFARNICLIGKRILEEQGLKWNFLLEGTMKYV
jgi:hypothetical protein